MAHCGTVKVDRHFLSQIAVTGETDTFKPIAHSALVDAIEESLSYRRIRIVRSEFAVSKYGMKMFGLLEVNNEFDGIRFAIGFGTPTTSQCVWQWLPVTESLFATI